MTAPRGKAIYTLGMRNYPNSDPAGYAAALDCQWIAFLSFPSYNPNVNATSDDQINRARDLGLQVLLWSGPDSWLPDNWPRSLDLLAERADRMNLPGFIADVERANVWTKHRDQLLPLGESLAIAASSFPSVGFTSFPMWGWVEEIAELAGPAGLWGSPQQYGGTTPPMAVKQWGERWKRAFPEVLPSLAAFRVDWDGSRPSAPYTLYEWEDYLNYYRDERGAIFWQRAGVPIEPWPGTEGFEILRRWTVSNLGGTTVKGSALQFFVQQFLHPFPRVRRA